MAQPSEIAKWREAHPQLELSEAALQTASPFPSLRVTEFMVFIENTQTEDVARYVRDLRRELTWTYDNWTKAVRDSTAQDLLADLITSAKGVGESAQYYEPIRKFLVDYAKANGFSEPEHKTAEYTFLGKVESSSAMPPPIPQENRLPEFESPPIPQPERDLPPAQSGQEVIMTPATNVAGVAVTIPMLSDAQVAQAAEHAKVITDA